MLLGITSQISNEEKVRQFELESDEKRQKAIEILQSLKITYIIHFSQKGNCIRFYKDNNCINIYKLPLEVTDLTINYYLYGAAVKLSQRKRFKTVVENDYVISILLDLYSNLRNIDPK